MNKSILLVKEKRHWASAEPQSVAFWRAAHGSDNQMAHFVPNRCHTPRSSAVAHGWQEDTPSVAERTPRPDDRLHWLDRVDGRHDAPPPGSRSTQAVATPLAISRIDKPAAIPREMSSRSDSVSVRGERRRGAGTIPPRCVNRNRIEPWPLPKARPISCNDSPAFQRRHISILCSVESLFRFPCAINTTF
jgi:hypothetical protein